MSVEEENKAKQRLVWEEVFNKRNLAIAPEIWATDFVDHTPLGDFKGGEGAKHTNMLFTAFPDLHVTIDDMFAEDDKVVSRVTVTGTFKGEYYGIAPTGKKLTMRVILITQWVDGKEVEAWAAYDMLAFYRQLDITPPTS